ncbi:hypothetical protein [Parasphingorhabdus sp.]|uniref:hypothetical protein n=1 Tax=Parasphingorhabdus sp. TaxID=2709688 RepID=UPI003A906CBA
MNFLPAAALAAFVMACQTSATADEFVDTDVAHEEQQQALTNNDADFGWLDGMWYDDCDQKTPLIIISVNADNIYAIMNPNDGEHIDPARTKTGRIERRADGFIDIIPGEASNIFLRVRRDINGHIVGELIERFQDTAVAMEAIAATQCPTPIKRR